MYISTSNLSKVATVTEVPESITQDIMVVTDGDYSSTYTATLSGQLTIKFTFPTPQDIEYIAFGGTNISRKDRLVITSNPDKLLDVNLNQLLDANGEQLSLASGQIDDTTLGLDESRVMTYKVDLKETSEVEIIIYGQGQIQISEIAMGKFYEVPRGEQSGYNRSWAVPNIRARSATGLDGAPINFVYETGTQTATLTVPNNLMSGYEAENGWREMLKYTSRNAFYVLEDDNKFHSYAGFSTTGMSTKAHSQTRLLGVSQFTFNTFSGTVI